MMPGLFVFSRRITPRTVIRGLGLGFAITVVLLGMAGAGAVRYTGAIRQRAAGLVREHLVSARLLHEVQVEENTLTEVLHQLVRAPMTADGDAMLRELDEADANLARLAAEASQAARADTWRELQQIAAAFSAHAREVLTRKQPGSQEAIDALFAAHDRVVQLSHQLLENNAAHLEQADRQLALQSRQLAGESAVLLGSCLVLATLCAMVTIIFVRHSVRRIEWQSDELNRVSWHMLQTQEETARRFSHELHDELGQALAALRANLTARSRDDAEERRADCVHLVDEAISNVREIAQLLRPVILDDFGLDAGLRWLAEKFGQRVRVDVKFESNFTGRLHSDTETHLFRIAQEALTNIARHAGAAEVAISLNIQNDQISLVVQDNGCGLGEGRQDSSASLGLIGMRARARECGGTLALEQVRPHGLRVVVTVPARRLPAAESDESSG